MNSGHEDLAKRNYRFEYYPGVIRCGQGCVAELGVELESAALDRALVVCGSTVGSTDSVIEPVASGLGDRHVGTFAETTPKKRLKTAAEGAKRAHDVDADALVAVGGGSSLDVAKAISVLAASERSLPDHRDRLAADGAMTAPSGPLLPIVAVPTTLAGADISYLAGISAKSAGGVVGGVVSDTRLMPSALFYDQDLFGTTPRDVLARSAMNGFNKGIETLYARTATPITDATASRGIAQFADGLPTLGSDHSADWNLDAVLDGLVLVQYGITRPNNRTTSVLHAFGHGLSQHCDIHQGLAHAVVAPHALNYLFENVHGRRDLIARALAVGSESTTSEETGAAVVEAVTEIRDAIGVPDRLRDVDCVDRSVFDDVAVAVRDDRGMPNAPPGLDPTVEDLREVLKRAW